MDFPKSVPSVGLVDGKFIDEDAVAGTPGSLIPSAWGNAVTLEILKVIQDAGLEPDEDDNTQLSAAIDQKISESSVAFATQPEAEAGESQTKVMSPLRVFQAIAKVVAQATESAFGWLKIATLSQTNTGTDDATAVTPKKLAAAVQTQTLNAGTTGGTATAYTVSNIPGMSSYVAKLRLNVTFHVGGGVNPTISVNALGAKSLKQYDASGGKISAVITAGMVSDIVYDGTDCVLLNQLPVKSKQGLRGAATNWKAVASGVSANIVCTAQQVVVADASGNSVVLDNLNLTLNTQSAASATVDGMASGATVVNTWYAVYVWYNSSTGVVRVTGDISLTSPTPPAAGFDFWARRSRFRTDSVTANRYPLGFIQVRELFQYGVAASSNVPSMVLLVGGAAGSVNDPPTWQAVSISSVVPPTAVRIYCVLAAFNGSNAIVSPNNAYGGINGSGNLGSSMITGGASATNFAVSQKFDMIIESSNIYYAAAASTPRLFCVGWEDSI